MCSPLTGVLNGLLQQDILYFMYILCIIYFLSLVKD